jgi:hypothetical protein
LWQGFRTGIGPIPGAYSLDGKMDAEGAQMTYLKRSRVRLLEVTVTAEKPTVWRWHISEHDLEIMNGYETSRESAQIKGDNALFKLLSEHGSDGVPPPRRGH